MSRKQIKHLLSSNFMGIADKVKHLRKPIKRNNNNRNGK
jgi:hypothetical protein